MRTWGEFSPAERCEALAPFLVRENVCPFTVEELVRWGILTTLEYYRGNRTRTAKHLKISIRGLRNHLSRYEHEGYWIPDSQTDYWHS